MLNQQKIINILKVAFPTGIIISLIWCLLPVTFYKMAWAQPGTTNLILFTIQSLAILALLFVGFQYYRNHFQAGFISFRHTMGLAAATAIGVAVFGMMIWQTYTHVIDPDFIVWQQEVLYQNWVARGYSPAEIQQQVSTSNWLHNTTGGLIYGFFFIIMINLAYSFIPAFLTVRKKQNSILL